MDANIVVAPFLRDSTIRRIVTLSLIDLLAPDLILEEVERHLPDLRKRAGLSKAQASELLTVLEGYLTLVPAEALLANWGRASRVLAAVDPKDTAYLAAALATDAPLWSDDPHLKRQSLVPCWTTKELVKALEEGGLDL